jgi:phosphotriesterase-related protein
VLPALQNSGVTDDQIETMLVHNPRRYFEGL